MMMVIIYAAVVQLPGVEAWNIGVRVIKSPPQEIFMLVWTFW